MPVSWSPGGTGVGSFARGGTDPVGRTADPRIRPQVTHVTLDTSFSDEQREHFHSFAM
jgi:hypothetical protein